MSPESANGPSQIGRYQVQGVLGQGAMGTVYLGEDPLLKRKVALKVVRDTADRERALARFRREAEVSARLNHPNVITVFDVGEAAGVGPFLAMEHVEGESLAQLLKQGPLPPARALDLLAQALEGLEAAHALEIVHRDVKPENFMVGAGGRLKLMDFGIAKGRDGGITTTSGFLGTPAYAAPELLRDQQPSPATDQWSFAVMAFEMLLGRAPFRAENLSALLLRIVNDPPAFPEGVEPGLREVLDKALRKDPRERFPSARAFLRALVLVLPLEDGERQDWLRWLDHPGRPVGLGTGVIRASRPRRPRRRWALAAAALLVPAALALWPRDTTRVLAIRTDPPGARVLLDGTPLGATPLDRVVVKGPARRLRVEKPGYEPQERELGPQDRKLDLALRPAPFAVAVRSEPAGAEVLVDGRPAGITPLERLEVPGEGRHTVKLRLDGYQSWSAPLERDRALPDPVRLSRPAPRKPKEEKGVKAFFKGLFARK